MYKEIVHFEPIYVNGGTACGPPEFDDVQFLNSTMIEIHFGCSIKKGWDTPTSVPLLNKQMDSSTIDVGFT